jgi:hypothetical protein
LLDEAGDLTYFSLAMFRPGESALLRNISGRRVLSALATVVVEDSPELTALYWEPGYPVKKMAESREKAVDIWLTGEDFVHVDGTWTYTRVLCLVTAGASHASWLVRRAEDEELLGWYVNLQTPLQRTSFGFDTTDQALDVIIRPDLTWRWKDEDELEMAIEHGLISPSEGKAIREEGERVLECALKREPPFGDGWETWHPDPTWPVPVIPGEWQRQ